MLEKEEWAMCVLPLYTVLPFRHPGRRQFTLISQYLNEFFNNLGMTQRGTAMSCFVGVNGVTFAGQGVGDWTGSGTMARQISVFKKQPKNNKEGVHRWSVFSIT